MPIEFSSIGGIGAAFTVTDEFSEPLTRAEVMLRETAKAAAAFATPARRWSAAAEAMGTSAITAAPKLRSLAAAAVEAADAIARSFTVATARAEVMQRFSGARRRPLRRFATLQIWRWEAG